MEWWLVVLGISLIAFTSGLTIGLYMPRATVYDVFINYVLLFIILIGTLSGLVLSAYGLQK